MGVLDPFWDSKGYISPEEYRRFCNSTVPLARMGKRVWSNAEIFKAEVQIAHFGPISLTNQVVSWQLINAEGKPEFQGDFPSQEIPIGNHQILGTVEFHLKDLKPAQKYQLVIRLDGTAFENDWDIWVFDPLTDVLDSEAMSITQELDENIITQLERGSKVLYIPPAEHLKVSSVIGFSSVFWNTAWTKTRNPTRWVFCATRATRYLPVSQPNITVTGNGGN